MSKATPCPEPLERLDPDPAVAVFALRFPSISEPTRTYDVALAPDGTWSCECFPWLEDDECKHVHDARARWYARRPCTHRLLFTDGAARECLLCGVRYDRSAFLARLRDLWRSRATRSRRGTSAGGQRARE